MPGPERTANQLAWWRCGRLLAATMVLWLLLLAPAWLLAGRDGLIGLSSAAVLCLAPGLIVFWIAAAFGTAGAQVPLVVLGATAFRLLFVLLGLLIIQTNNPRLGLREFVVWLMAFYFGTLLVETSLALPRADRRGPASHAGAG